MKARLYNRKDLAKFILCQTGFQESVIDHLSEKMKAWGEKKLFKEFEIAYGEMPTRISLDRYIIN